MRSVIQTDIDGLSEADAIRAKAELDFATSIFQQYLNQQGSNNDEIDLSVSLRITNRFEEEISQNETQTVPNRIFRQQREYILVLGKTLCKVSGSHLEASIFLDASLFSSDANPLFRVITPYHELFHVLAALGRLKLGRSQAPDLSTYAGQFRKLALYIHEEHEVDCCVDNLFRACKFAKDQHGNVLGILESVGGIEGVLGMIEPYFEHWCSWVVNRIQRYRETSQGLEEIPGELDKLQDFLTALTHAIAACRGAGALDSLKKRLLEIRGFRCFILPNWDDWITVLAQPSEQAIEHLIRLEHAFLERCGLRFDDMEGGSVYIHVSEPCFCENV